MPLVVLAGAEYGTGSSRDWAAKGTLLLGVRAVIAVSFERIHRSNLVGMGVLPLEFPHGQTWQSLGLTGEETFDIPGLDEQLQPGAIAGRRRHGSRRLDQKVRLPRPHRHAGRTRLLPQRRHSADGAAKTARELTQSADTSPTRKRGFFVAFPSLALRANIGKCARHLIAPSAPANSGAPVPGRPVPGCPGSRRSLRPG